MQVSVVLGKPQPKQREFMLAKAKYVAFGGARGGGKSWSVREKAKRLALKWAGIKILIIRKTYTDLRDNHILPLKTDLPDSLAPYKEADKAFCFRNGSRIKCSYFANDSDALLCDLLGISFFADAGEARKIPQGSFRGLSERRIGRDKKIANQEIWRIA